MKLEETLLQELASWRPDNSRQTLSFDHPATGWRIELTADCVDTVGSRLWEVVLKRMTPPSGVVPLADQARRIVDRVTGLMEPLRLIEIDTGRDVAQLRSGAPAVKEEAVYYYEVLRQTDGTTTVRRFQATPGTSKRQAVAFALTNEALAKLVWDLARD